MRWIKQIFRRGRRPALSQVETISEERLQERFLNAPDNPLWLATLAALDLQVQEALNEVLEETLTNEQMRYRIGGVAELLTFKAHLQDREREARQTQRQIEAQAAQEKRQA